MQRMLDITLRQFAGPFADFISKLLGPDGPRIWWPAFKAFLRKENPWDGRKLFPIWKTVTIRANQNYGDLELALQREMIGTKEISRAGLKYVAVHSREFSVDLICLRVSELGFHEGASYAEIFRRLVSYGLRLCTPEMLVEARMEYNDQTDSEEVLVGAMRQYRYGHDFYLLTLETDEAGTSHDLGFVSYNDFPGPDVEIICCYPS